MIASESDFDDEDAYRQTVAIIYGFEMLSRVIFESSMGCCSFLIWKKYDVVFVN